MGKVYKTAQGKVIDIEKLRLQNELTPAIGNMRVNARGDQLGPGGQIVKSREEMLDDHYKNSISKRPKQVEPDVIPTRGGKSKRVESFEPGAIEADSAVVKPTKVSKTSTTENKIEKPAVPVQQNIDAASIVSSTVETNNKTEPSLKGGLARAIAKTKDYEDSKNKPKRI